MIDTSKIWSKQFTQLHIRRIIFHIRRIIFLSDFQGWLWSSFREGAKDDEHVRNVKFAYWKFHQIQYNAAVSVATGGADVFFSNQLSDMVLLTYTEGSFFFERFGNLSHKSAITEILVSLQLEFCFIDMGIIFLRDHETVSGLLIE